MTAFEHEALWNKSKIFIDRALVARDGGDELGFHLWASMSLELLGKAALASVHPALVADPSHFTSLLSACGRPVGTSRRTVTAKTVFERLRTISNAFDDKMMRECMVMADRRNAELHSGQSPLVGLDQRGWVPAMWRSAAVILNIQQQSLAEWLGSDEAERVDAIIADAAEVHWQGVLARIDRRRADFAKRSPKGSAQYTDAAQRARVRPEPRSYEDVGHAKVWCPLCGLPVWATGVEYDREVIEEHFGYDPEDGYPHSYLQTVRVSYAVEMLSCGECDLLLEGREEIEMAEIEADFTRDIEEEPEMYEEYGNE